MKIKIAMIIYCLTETGTHHKNIQNMWGPRLHLCTICSSSSTIRCHSSAATRNYPSKKKLKYQMHTLWKMEFQKRKSSHNIDSLLFKPCLCIKWKSSIWYKQNYDLITERVRGSRNRWRITSQCQEWTKFKWHFEQAVGDYCLKQRYHNSYAFILKYEMWIFFSIYLYEGNVSGMWRVHTGNVSSITRLWTWDKLPVHLIFIRN